MTHIENSDFKIWYDKTKNTVFFEGSLRLWDPDAYREIKQLLLDVYEHDHGDMRIDFSHLEFLNSSGISMLVKFIFEIKKRGNKPLIIVGSDDYLWQQKSFDNLRKLWEYIQVQMV